ncbi:hypothetical protein Vadar_009287 [Vaccinium darrowii]|uniref:Uncharacterized protein n=1 Tax=Vaccinium darrowii TaxID=229202 RepID=A0ACB7Y727_9ERIC|nr:hypothetical protein Vadar_009287 [Vaccinium darrowii]
MAATSDEEMDSLLSSFDQIYNDVKYGITQMQMLQSNCSAEVQNREALQLTANSLKLDNQRLTKLYTGSLNKLADQLERRTSCQSLKEELDRVRDDHRRIENEYRNAMELLQQDYTRKIQDLENQIRVFLVQKTADEGTIKQLHEDVVVHKTHSESLNSKLKRVHFDVETQYHHEIQDLRDCLMMEQEEKNDLNRKLQILEKELIISRTKLAEHHRDSTSNRHVETLKQKIMKLRKENEELPRVLPGIRAKAAKQEYSRRAAVLLRDLGSRLSPVFYHDRSGIKVLTSGWEAFARANSVQPRDECSFELEDKRDSQVLS